MSPRALALLLLPLAACELYLREDDGDDGDVPPWPVDGGGLPDAAGDTDAGVPPDAAVPPDAPTVDVPNPGFVTPTATTRAHVFRNGAWTDVGPADWSCVDQPPAEPTPDGGYTLAGTVRDAANNGRVGGVAISASAGGQVLGLTMSSNDAGNRGQYRVELAPLPGNASRVRFALSGMGARRTVAMDRYLGPFAAAALDLPLVSESTATTFPALVGELADASDGFVLGEVRDCQGRQVSGAIVALSTSPAFVAHWPGGVSFYFSSASPSLPVRHAMRTQTSADGRFMILGAAPAGIEATVQAYGFRTEADRASGTLRPLGSSAAVIEAGTASHVITGRSRAAN